MRPNLFILPQATPCVFFFNTEALQQNDNTYQSMYILCSIYGTDLEIILLNNKNSNEEM